MAGPRKFRQKIGIRYEANRPSAARGYLGDKFINRKT